MASVGEARETNLEVVNFTSDHEGERRRKSLLQQRRHLTGGIQLCPERRHPQVVFRTDHRDRVPPRRCNDELQVSGDIDLLG